MQISIQVSADVARTLHKQNPPSSEVEGLLSMVETFCLTLKPMHPNTDDLNLQSYFTVEVPDHATAQLVINRFRQSEAIKAVYVKPPDELS